MAVRNTRNHECIIKKDGKYVKETLPVTLLYGVGYNTKTPHKTIENGKNTPAYVTWQNMIQRSYDAKYHAKSPQYSSTTVFETWQNFQNFADWYYENVPDVNERFALDKDLLCMAYDIEHKIYSPDTCLFLPQWLNNIIRYDGRNTKQQELPTGISYNPAAKHKYHITFSNALTGKEKISRYYPTLETAVFECIRFHTVLLTQYMNSDTLIPYKGVKEALKLFLDRNCIERYTATEFVCWSKYIPTKAYSMVKVFIENLYPRELSCT